MMKIALDATPLTVPSGGVRRYTEELSRALAQTFPEDQFWLLSDQRFTTPFSRSNLKAGQGPRSRYRAVAVAFPLKLLLRLFVGGPPDAERLQYAERLFWQGLC